jgi:hypothetical protein
MPPKKRLSLQEINRRRQSDLFVGYEDQLNQYRTNLWWTPLSRHQNGA